MNKIDELSFTKTTAQVIKYYTKQGHIGRVQMARDMQTCSKGNRIAIEAALGMETEQYKRHEPLPEEEKATID